MIYDLPSQLLFRFLSLSLSLSLSHTHTHTSRERIFVRYRQKLFWLDILQISFLIPSIETIALMGMLYLYLRNSILLSVLLALHLQEKVLSKAIIMKHLK